LTIPNVTGEPDAGLGAPRALVVDEPPLDDVLAVVLLLELLPEEPQAATPITAADASSPAQS
jgi:hypothetical protein